MSSSRRFFALLELARTCHLKGKSLKELGSKWEEEEVEQWWFRPRRRGGRNWGGKREVEEEREKWKRC